MAVIKQELGDKDPSIALVYSQCQKFLIQAVQQIQSRFSDVYRLDDFVSCLLPTNAYNLKIPSLSGLYSKMPILKEAADLQKVHRGMEKSFYESQVERKSYTREILASCIQ